MPGRGLGKKCQRKIKKLFVWLPAEFGFSGGQNLIVFWDKSGVPSDHNETIPATLTIRGGSFAEPVWVDVITGGIHEIPPDRIVRDGDTTVFKDIPVYDAPALIADRSLIMR